MNTNRFSILFSFCCAVLGLDVDVLGHAQEKEKNMFELTISFSKKVIDPNQAKPDEFSCELKNVSGKPITIVLRGSNGLRDYITHYWRHPGGDWGEGQKANILLSDLGVDRIPHILEPGKVLGYKNIPAPQGFPYAFKLEPGKYQMKSVFEYQDPDDSNAPILRAESNVAEIEFRPRKK